jgi:hypothetical protein
MAVYRQVYITFWQDPFIMDLTPEEKYFYLYLMTNSKTKQCGCYELPKRIMEFETGYNRETVDKLIDRFVEYGKIKYDETTNEMLLINWIKFNPINNINIEKCVEKELSLIKSKPLLKLLEGLIRGYDTPTKKEEKEEEKEEEEKKPRAGKFIPPTVTEVSSYCKERKNDVDAERFCDFYQSKNWYVGKNKMRDWRASVRTWEKKDGAKSREVYL